MGPTFGKCYRIEDRTQPLRATQGTIRRVARCVIRCFRGASSGAYGTWGVTRRLTVLEASFSHTGATSGGDRNLSDDPLGTKGMRGGKYPQRDDDERTEPRC